MNINAIRTHRIEPHESLASIVQQYIPVLPEKSIVAITSKIVSLCEGRIRDQLHITKSALIAEEADQVLRTTPSGFALTLKAHRFIPSAGIDESNGDGIYILHPADSQHTAATLWATLRTHYQIAHLGILITDSQVTPLRRGVTGIGLGWCGFRPLYSYEGKPDLYGKPFRVTQVNLLDALATAAVLVMGEGAEQTPLAVIHQAPHIDFLTRTPTPEEEASVVISPEEDLFSINSQHIG